MSPPVPRSAPPSPRRPRHLPPDIPPPPTGILSAPPPREPTADAAPSLQPLRPPTPERPTTSPQHHPGGQAAGMGVGAVVLMAAVAALVVFLARRWRQKRQGEEGDVDPTQPKLRQLPAADSQLFSKIRGSCSSSAEGTGTSSSVSTGDYVPVVSVGIKTFTYEELSQATNQFSKDNFLGQGGFGSVYRGFLIGGDVAIKQLQGGSLQGEREFLTEINVISRVHHRNLVSLVGYCISGPERLLVYEFVENNNLFFHLRGTMSFPVLDWATRMSIAFGAAKGIAYLHEECHPKVIHRDIKSNNILLDSKFKAKVADFGLAKFVPDDKTHVTTRIIGTFGYVAPEYGSSGRLTEKSDVFSFGVVLLELITGRQPINLVEWASPFLEQALEDGKFETELIDPKLADNYDYEEMNLMVTCAAICVHRFPDHRPRMSQVAQVLEGSISPEKLKADYSRPKTRRSV